MGIPQWLELLHQFTMVIDLYLIGELGCISRLPAGRGSEERATPLCKVCSYGTLVVGVSSGGIWALHHCETAFQSPHSHIG